MSVSKKKSMQEDESTPKQKHEEVYARASSEGAGQPEAGRVDRSTAENRTRKNTQRLVATRRRTVRLLVTRKCKGRDAAR
jgi:hypothetical protein